VNLLKRLQALLTEENLVLLDKVLSMLVEGQNPQYTKVYTAFWAEFDRIVDPGAKSKAWAGLRELLVILREWRSGR